MKSARETVSGKPNRGAANDPDQVIQRTFIVNGNWTQVCRGGGISGVQFYRVNPAGMGMDEVQFSNCNGKCYAGIGQNGKQHPFQKKAAGELAS